MRRSPNKQPASSATADFKVTTQIQGEQVRVTAKSLDESQAIIAAVRSKDFPLALGFANFRN